MTPHLPLSYWRQQGAIVLVTVVLMLVMITLVTLYTGRIQSFEHKIALNGQNQHFAYAAASAGLAQGIAELQRNKSWPVANIDGALSNQQQFTVTASVQLVPRYSQNLSLFTLSSTGSSQDGLSEVTLSEQAIVYPLLVTIPAAPLMTDGGLDIRTNFTLVANPNGGGQGVPLSLWTNDSADMNQINGLTCGAFEYQQQLCQARAYSGQGAAGPDILANDLAFPADVFGYLFNVSMAHYATLRDEADLVLADCTTLSQQVLMLIWVRGDCDVAANSALGAPNSPVILLIEEGDLRIGSDAIIHGLVVLLKDPANVGTHDVHMNGGSVLNGALVANQVLGRSAGTIYIVYAQATLAALRTAPAFLRIARVPGSWRDL